jgi:hypothetical protein
MNDAQTRQRLQESLENPKLASAVSIACCIARASVVQTRQYSESEHILPKDFHPPIDDIYWETRELALQLSNTLNIFFPVILQIYTAVIHALPGEEIERLSRPFWLDLMSPKLLVLQVMDS